MINMESRKTSTIIISTYKYTSLLAVLMALYYLWKWNFYKDTVIVILSVLFFTFFTVFTILVQNVKIVNAIVSTKYFIRWRQVGAGKISLISEYSYTFVQHFYIVKYQDAGILERYGIWFSFFDSDREIYEEALRIAANEPYKSIEGKN